MKLRFDHRSYDRNLSNCKKFKPEKKKNFRASTVEALKFFFSGLNFLQLLKLRS